jgi:hypothetical protein
MAKNLFIFITILLLTGCGGGGGSDPTPTYTVSFSVSGLLSGQQLTVADNSSDSKVLTANGSFVFNNSINRNGSYSVAVTQQPTGQICSVSNASGSGVIANITNVSVICSTTTYTVGGTVIGLPLGSSVSVALNGSNPLTTGAGSFTFSSPIAFGSTYSVTVATQPIGYTCSVINGSGTIPTSNVGTVNVICSTASYSIGGTVTGLASGNQVTLLNNNNQYSPLTVTANGAFSFPLTVSYGGSYSVSVGTDPTSQYCSITGAQGSNVASTVSNVNVTCHSCTTLTGVMSSSATYSSGAYCVSGTLQVPGGVTATFNGGTTIADGTIVVQGTLNLNGTLGSASTEVNVINVAIQPAGTTTSTHQISIAGSVITGGTLYAPTGNAIYGSFSLTNSIISNLQSYMYLWYPIGSNQITGNSFNGSGGISYGIDFRNSSVIGLSINNNYFASWTGPYAIENWVQYGSGSVSVQNNTFATTSSVALMLPAGYTSVVLNAPNNYWGTTNLTTIQSMIYDKTNDVTSGGYVTYQPILTSPAVGTPTQ